MFMYNTDTLNLSLLSVYSSSTRLLQLRERHHHLSHSVNFPHISITILNLTYLLLVYFFIYHLVQTIRLSHPVYYDSHVKHSKHTISIPRPQITHFATKQILPNIIVPCSHPACMKLLCIVPNIKATINSSMTYHLRFTPRCLQFGGSSHPPIFWQLPGTSHSQSVLHAFPST